MDCTEHRVPLPALPEELTGLRVAQLSDFHRSRLTSDTLLREAVTLTLRWKPDLILLTGDFVNGDLADLAPCMEILSPLCAPLGVFAVLGNHDVRAGVEAVTTALEAAGIVVLCNSHRRLANGLYVVGLEEDWNGIPDPALAFAGVPDAAPTLVLAHNPGEADLVSDRACLVFSGHTHGGQIRLPFLTPRVLRWIKAKHYRAGWYATGKAKVYVNRGLGNADVPFRFRCPPEVAFFTLQAAHASSAK